tara:strand:- start:13215 stop:14192 length:978 start_codon:yes stop_codon:yes gene_type:complete
MDFDNKIKTLYEDGLVNLGNPFDDSFVSELKRSSNELFDDFPFGQDDNLKKKTSSDFVRPGSYMIWDLLERKSIFSKILEQKYLKDVALRVLGSDYIITSLYIRKTPKINETLKPHIDNRGSVSFSILLDDIKKNEGETFFYPGSHKLPPPPFVDLNKQSHKETSITGKAGETFFWFPDCWHGRNPNNSEKETTILMCHLGNQGHPRIDPTGRVVNYNKNIPLNKNSKSFLQKYFKFFGESPNNLFKHFIYCLTYFKITSVAKKAISEKIIYARKKYGTNEIDSFSIYLYLKSINYLKTMKIFIKSSLKIVLGKKNSEKIKKFLR